MCVCVRVCARARFLTSNVYPLFIQLVVFSYASFPRRRRRRRRHRRRHSELQFSESVSSIGPPHAPHRAHEKKTKTNHEPTTRRKKHYKYKYIEISMSMRFFVISFIFPLSVPRLSERKSFRSVRSNDCGLC